MWLVYCIILFKIKISEQLRSPSFCCCRWSCRAKMEEKKLFLNVFENDASVSDVHLDDGFDFYTHLRRRCCVRPSLSLSLFCVSQCVIACVSVNGNGNTQCLHNVFHLRFFCLLRRRCLQFLARNERFWDQLRSTYLGHFVDETIGRCISV